MNLLVWIHSCPARRHTRQAVARSLEASDVACFEMREAPDHHRAGRRAVMRWWRAQLIEQAKYPDDTVIVRLEDDILVNPHLAHNVLHWPALTASDFGIGSLFMTDADLRHSLVTECGLRRATLGYTGTAQAQVYRPAELREWLEHVEIPDSITPDLVACAAVWRAGLAVYIHEPPLVTGLPLTPSAITGRVRGHPAFGFDATWRARHQASKSRGRSKSSVQSSISTATKDPSSGWGGGDAA